MEEMDKQLSCDQVIITFYNTSFSLKLSNYAFYK